jgi:sRNA-binding regulator protein Hfq
MASGNQPVLRCRHARIIGALLCLSFLLIAGGATSPLFAEAQPSGTSAPQADPDTDRAERLLELAKRKFGKLSRLEESFFQAAAKGEMTTFSAGSEKDDDPSNAESWSADRTLAADRIAWLCTEPLACSLVSCRGIMVQGVRVDGPLDLQFARMPFPLYLRNCAVRDQIALLSAELRGLYLIGTHTKGIDASGMKVEGGVLLRNGFKAEGEVNLVRATVSLILDCSGAQIINKGTNAFSATGLKTEGSVLLKNGFEAEGQVNLVDATVGGDLECDGAQIINKSSKALNAAGLKVEGAILLRNGFKAEGEVSLAYASVGQNLECDGAQIINKGGKAIYADGLRVGGSVFLRHGYRAEGLVGFAGATVGRYFIWERISVDSDATLDLRSARAGALRDDEKSWPMRGKLRLNGFVYEEIGSGAPTDAKSRIEWLHRQPADQFLPQPYEQLAMVLRKAGHEGDARQVLIAKNRDRAGRVRWYQPIRWWYCLLDQTIRYGYRPGRAFGWSCCFIGAGWILSSLGHKRKLLTPTREGTRENHPKFSAPIYSLETFVPLVDLRVKDYWLLNGDGRAEFNVRGIKLPLTGKWLRRYFWFHTIAGWVLTTLLVGALTGLIKT